MAATAAEARGRRLTLPSAYHAVAGAGAGAAPVRALFFLALIALHALRVEAGAQVGRQPPLDALDDDDAPALERLRSRLAAPDVAKGKLGVVMVAGARESHSQLTVPVWREYCKKHGVPFFFHEEPLSTGLSFEWTKPRLLMELLPAVRWRYAFVVDANTLPVDFGKSFDFMTKVHMRQKRYANDDPNKRFIFCPWNCEEDYVSSYQEGSCSGAVLSGCIFWAQKPYTASLVREWYALRHDDALPEDNKATKALDQLRARHYQEIFYKDVQQDVGKASSRFIKAFGWSKEFGFDIRRRIHDFIAEHPKLSKVANRAAKEADGEL